MRWAGGPCSRWQSSALPINTLSQRTIRDILRGGEAVCEQAGIPIAGGHSIDSVEPIYGLAVTGVVDPKKLKRNSSARSGDALILGKPLGVGIFLRGVQRRACWTRQAIAP